MIGQITPLVQGGSSHKPVVAHVAGGLIGGALAGVWWGLLGILVSTSLTSLVSSVPTSSVAVLVGALCLAAGVVDLGLVRARPFARFSRQTPRSWLCVFGGVGAAFAWGFDLAQGVTTQITYASIALVPALALLSGRMDSAVLIMTAFGVARAGSVALQVQVSGDANDRCSAVDQRFGFLQRTAGLSAVALASVVLALSF